MNVLTQLLPFLYRWCRVWWQRNPARCVRHWWLPVHQSQQYSTSGAWWKDTERAHVRETDGRGLTSSRWCWWFWRGRGWGIYGWVNSLCLFSFPVEFIEGLLFLLIVQKLVLKKKIQKYKCGLKLIAIKSLKKMHPYCSCLFGVNDCCKLNYWWLQC